MDETLSVIFAALHSADLPIDAMIHLAYVWVSHWRNYYGQKNATSTIYVFSINTANFDDTIYVGSPFRKPGNW